MKKFNVLFNYIYRGLIELFYYFILVFVIAIALVAFAFNEGLDFECEQSADELESDLEDKKYKSESRKRLDEQTEYDGSSDDSNDADGNDLYEEERLFHIIQNNLEAYYKNKFEVEFPNHTVETVSLSLQEQEELQLRLAEFISYVESLKNEKDENNLEDLEDIKAIIDMFFSSEPSTPASNSSESEFRRIVGMIGQGEDVMIYSPSTSDSSDSANVYTTYTGVSTQDAPSTPVTPDVPVKPVVIITKKVEEGDPIPPLPGWGHLQYDDPDYGIKRRINWKRFVRDYDNSHKLPSDVPSDRNQGWMENENYGLEELFKDEDPKK